ncbi:hypothetical protein D3C79_990060 [compost metagenome]
MTWALAALAAGSAAEVSALLVAARALACSAASGSTSAFARSPVTASTDSVMSSRRKSGAGASSASLTSTAPRWASTAGAIERIFAASGWVLNASATTAARWPVRN